MERICYSMIQWMFLSLCALIRCVVACRWCCPTIHHSIIHRRTGSPLSFRFIGLYHFHWPISQSKGKLVGLEWMSCHNKRIHSLASAIYTTSQVPTHEYCQIMNHEIKLKFHDTSLIKCLIFNKIKTKNWVQSVRLKHYPLKVAAVKYVDGAMRHLSLKLSASKTPVLPSQNVAKINWLLQE